MKRLLLGILITTSLLSCQSEYDRQLDFGKSLVKKESKIVNQLVETHFNDSAREELISLKKQLNKHAVLSGNKELFMEQMANFRSQIQEDGSRLITKFP